MVSGIRRVRLSAEGACAEFNLENFAALDTPHR
jgi:hypothetical protein